MYKQFSIGILRGSHRDTILVTAFSRLNAVKIVRSYGLITTE